MRRLFVVAALISGIMSLSMPTAWAAGRDTARAEGVRGDSSVRISSSASWQSLEGGLELAPGASLRTAKGAEALLSLPGDVVLRVAPDSEVQVSRMEGRNIGLRLQSGRVFASVPTQEGGATQLEVQTPAGVALSSGGEFTVDAGQKTGLRVLSGSARLSGQRVSYGGASSSGQSLQVPAGAEAVAQNTQDKHDDSKCDCRDKNCPCQHDTSLCNTDKCNTYRAHHRAGGKFPIFAVLGGLGLLALIALLIGESSTVQSG